jgi:glucose-6-phosphate isomerase, archaeal
MLFPEGVAIDGATGEVSPSTGRYEKRLSELAGLFRNRDAVEEHLRRHGDSVAYEVIDYRKPESDIAFGTTIMSPGVVAGEYLMTRGHFHIRRECGEIYYTQSGEGLLLLESRDGECRTVEMKPGVCAFIPPDWAHRSVNVGPDKLVFVWACATDAGHEYGEILERGMRQLVVERDGRPALVPNPAWAD